MSASTSWMPSAKVAGGTVAGAATTIVLWLLERFAHLQLPAPVTAAIGVLAVAGVAYWLPGANTGSDIEPPLTDDEKRQIQKVYVAELERIKRVRGG